MNRSKISLFISSVLLISAAEYSQATEFNANVGVGAAHIQSHVKGEKDENQIFPYAELQYGMLTLDPDGLGITAPISATSAVSFVLKIRESGFDETDNQELAHLTKREDTGELMVNWFQAAPWADFNAFVSADLMDKHKGYELGLGVSKQVPILGGVLIPQAGIQYQSAPLVDYYYGVSRAESTTLITAYDGKASVNANASLTHIYKLFGGWHTATTVGINHLGTGISDSSIVARDNYWMGSASVFYQF